MRQKWEYLILDWKAKRGGYPEERVRSEDLYIRRPGAKEPEVRPLWSSDDPSASGSVLDVLNELGAEGWELVTDAVMDSVLLPTGDWSDWSEVGHPVRTQRILKRPAET